jgi:sterol desaturase/sphingolipid hydroxylase (fatty acid hydroxylase superfamily)
MKNQNRWGKYISEAMPYLVLVGIVALLYIYLRPLIKETQAYIWVQQNIYYPSLKSIANLFYNKIFFIAVPSIFLLEKLFPAKPTQQILSTALVQDAVWMILEACFEVTIIIAYVNFLSSIYQQNFSFLTITAIQQLPMQVKFIIGVLVSDFLAWLHHWIRHLVPWFWEFHTLHHSQKKLNMFTAVRYHVMEYIFAKTIITFPLLMVAVTPGDVVFYAVFYTWFTQLYHANIKSNFGLLRYIFVTPQSHRIHHSIELRHQNKNFGALLSIWDQLFGTQYRGYDEYPDTGIADDHFPLEKSIKGLNLLLNPIYQHIYPFQSIFRKILASPARTSMVSELDKKEWDQRPDGVLVDRFATADVDGTPYIEVKPQVEKA